MGVVEVCQLQALTKFNKMDSKKIISARGKLVLSSLVVFLLIFAVFAVAQSEPKKKPLGKKTLDPREKFTDPCNNTIQNTGKSTISISFKSSSHSWHDGKLTISI